MQNESGDNVSRHIGMVKRKSAKEQFAMNLHKAMIAADMTQAELARAAGVGRDKIWRYIRKISLPTENSLQAIAKALRVEPTKLIPDYEQAKAELAEELPFSALQHPNDPAMVTVRFKRTIKFKALAALIKAFEEAEEVE